MEHTTCSRASQLIAFDGQEWRTTEWPKGLALLHDHKTPEAYTVEGREAEERPR
jgi:hypothetical protein